MRLWPPTLLRFYLTTAWRVPLLSAARGPSSGHGGPRRDILSADGLETPPGDERGGVRRSAYRRGPHRTPRVMEMVWTDRPAGRGTGQEDASRLAAHDTVRVCRAARHALRVHPGPVGELVHRELLAYANFGYRFDRSGLVMRLVEDLQGGRPELPFVLADALAAPRSGQ